MPRPRLHPDHPLTSSERVERFRANRGLYRQEVLLDVTSSRQIAGFAERWRCSRQEVLKAVFRACLPAMKESHSTEDLFDRVRDALEAADGAKRFRKRDG